MTSYRTTVYHLNTGNVTESHDEPPLALIRYGHPYDARWEQLSKEMDTAVQGHVTEARIALVRYMLLQEYSKDVVQDGDKLRLGDAWCFADGHYDGSVRQLRRFMFSEQDSWGWEESGYCDAFEMSDAIAYALERWPNCEEDMHTGDDEVAYIEEVQMAREDEDEDENLFAEEQPGDRQIVQITDLLATQSHPVSGFRYHDTELVPVGEAAKYYTNQQRCDWDELNDTGKLVIVEEGSQC